MEQFDWSNIIATIIGALVSWISIWFQQRQEKRKVAIAQRKELRYQVKEQINLCNEIKHIKFEKYGAISSEYTMMQDIWQNLYHFRYESDFAILNSQDNDEIISAVFSAWRELWRQYNQTCKSISARTSKGFSLNSLQQSKRKLNEKLDEYCKVLEDTI